MNKRNLGKFSISVIEVECNPDRVAKILSLLKVVPIRARYLFDRGVIEYLAIGEYFEEVPEYAYAPEYRVHTECDGDEVVSAWVSK